MATDNAEPLGQTGQKRCPVCWTWFTPNSTHNPQPRRYCCGACRMEDWRRRHEAEQTRLFLDAKLAEIRALNTADAERREEAQARRLLEQWRHPMNPD